MHQFHIPVMGTGHSIDTPIRVAHLGISSVISIVDDHLIEKVRQHYCTVSGREYIGIGRTSEDSRARRIAAYLDLVHDLVHERFEELKAMSFFTNSEKDRYFQLMPDNSTIKRLYDTLKRMEESVERTQFIQKLTDMMQPGSIDVNIMAKVDRLMNGKDGVPLAKEFSDASASLRGFAMSKVQGALVLSAGFNPRLYSYLSEFKDFYRNEVGELKKRIILKVSDFRSAIIQGKFLAKSGLEVDEFRIESGLNCGGHAFASDGQLLPSILRDFRDQRQNLIDTFKPMVHDFYTKMGWTYPESAMSIGPKITVQGGIGTYGETRRLFQSYRVDSTGWGSPFLLVPEATCVDDETTQLLANAGESDLFLSQISPLGVPFNTVRGTGSERWTQKQAQTVKPGSKCPYGFLRSNSEFTDEAICTASTEYQVKKLEQINHAELTEAQKATERERVLQKTCLCVHLGVGSLIRLGVYKPNHGRQEICPGPNLAWFNRTYTLNEMVDHIYGRGESLVPAHRPHMFSKEITMNVDFLRKKWADSPKEKVDVKKCTQFAENILAGMEACEEFLAGPAYKDENLDELRATIAYQRGAMKAFVAELNPELVEQF